MNNKAFTLIELSIVLVIIGLIVGGVLVGQDLIKGAKIRRFVSEIEQINTQANTFRLKYNALPGDMATAHDVFGNDCDSTANNCNGDGNRSIDVDNNSGSGNINWYMNNHFKERCMFWKHLFLAGLRSEGNYGCSSADITSNNAPKTPFSATAYYMVSVKCNPGVIYASCSPKANFILGEHYLFTGGDSPSSPDQWFRNFINNNDREAFTTIQAFNIDNKIDDGLPTTGSTVVPASGNTGFADIADSSTDCVSGSDTYDINFTEIACHLRIKMAF